MKAHYERHTLLEFGQAEQPFGNTAQLSPPDESAAFLNLLQHTGVIRLDDRGYLSYSVTDDYKPLGKYRILLDTRKAAEGTPEWDSQLHLNDLSAHINQEGEWFRFLADRLRLRLRIAFAHTDSKRRKAALQYVTRYVTREDRGKGFPFLPHAFVAYVQQYTDDQSAAHKDFARFLEEHEIKNLRKTQHIRKNSSDLTVVARSSSDLDKMCDLPRLTHFQHDLSTVKKLGEELEKKPEKKEVAPVPAKAKKTVRRKSPKNTK